ncbi:MAG: NAD(P)H-binding protein [Acidiferrobacterales bacterium]
MKIALVMGITGGFGGHVAQALARKGYSIRALMRNPGKLPQRFKGAKVIIGDAAKIEDVRTAADGVDLIVYAVNPPKYRWEGVVLPLMENTARVAEEKNLTVVFPGNVYVFDPRDGPLFDEDAPHNPVSSKGHMRKEMEARLKIASENGARVIIIRMGDFIGENLPSTWFQFLIKSTKKGYVLAAAGKRNLIHTWAYLPDVGRTVAELVERKKILEDFSVFHFKGYQVSFNDIAQAMEQASGRPVSLASFPWIALQLMSPFNKMYKGLLEMRYLWNAKINLDETRLESALGKAVQHTPLAEALLECGFVEHRAGSGQPVRS